MQLGGPIHGVSLHATRRAHTWCESLTRTLGRARHTITRHSTRLRTHLRTRTRIADVTTARRPLGRGVVRHAATAVHADNVGTRVAVPCATGTRCAGR